MGPVLGKAERWSPFRFKNQLMLMGPEVNSVSLLCLKIEMQQRSSWLAVQPLTNQYLNNSKQVCYAVTAVGRRTSPAPLSR